MRVTKAIKEYIEKEVTARVHPKYAAEEAEAKRQVQEKSNFLEACMQAAEEAYNARFDELFPSIADFAEDDRNKVTLSFYNSHTVSIKDRCYVSSIHHWYDRERAECKKLVDKIIVNLELGGDKATLMEMLNKIGEGE